MSEDRKKVEKKFKDDLLAVINKEYKGKGYSMNMKWKTDVLVDIWADMKKDYKYV